MFLQQQFCYVILGLLQITAQTSLSEIYVSHTGGTVERIFVFLFSVFLGLVSLKLHLTSLNREYLLIPLFIEFKGILDVLAFDSH